MYTIYAKLHTLMFELTHLNVLFCVLKQFADENAFLVTLELPLEVNSDANKYTRGTISKVRSSSLMPI